MNMTFFRESEGAVTLTLKVVPRSSKSQIVGIEGDALKIRLNAPPVEGKANRALVEFLAEHLGVPRSNIEILIGHSGRHKLIRVRGVGAEKIQMLATEK